ncbi:MAG: helix-turn-helix domain-containing protein [Bacteroidota bacterium]
MTNENIKYKTSRLSEEKLTELALRIGNYVETNKVYLNPLIRMNKLAEELKIQNHILSQVINRYYKTSFFEFINSYRIKKAIEQISKNTNNKMKIASLGFYCGFNTRTSFIKSFKNHTGVSPSKFKLTENNSNNKNLNNIN